MSLINIDKCNPLKPPFIHFDSLFRISKKGLLIINLIRQNNSRPGQLLAVMRNSCLDQASQRRDPGARNFISTELI